jgi:small conductance mechanosensitive channel
MVHVISATGMADAGFDLPADLADDLHQLFRALVAHVWAATPRVAMGLFVFLSFWLGSLLVRDVIQRLARATNLQTGYVLKLTGRMAELAMMAFGVLTALGTMGLNVTALMTGLGLMGFALGFALKDIVSNLVAGLLILFYQPFQPNDYLMVAGFEGTVSEMDLRYTTLQRDGNEVRVPNSMLFTNSIGLIKNKQGLEKGEAPASARRVV